MDKHFNLLDEQWLPVRYADGKTREVGLIDLFKHASEIESLAEASPVSLVALHRVLLAIVHRALTLKYGRWVDADRVRWFREGLPAEAIIDYLEKFRERFWLFHPELPFMQVAALAHEEETKDKIKSWTQISLGNASGASPTVFDHSLDSAPTAIAPAEALRLLLGFLQFTPGGLVKVLRSSDKAGPLANTAAVLPCGDVLHQTLSLCLHQPESVDDPPAWEVPAISLLQLKAGALLSSGVNDRYTRLSRAVLLHRDDDGAVRHLRFAAGLGMEEDPNAPDPMTSFRVGLNGLVRLGLSEGRAFWRDLPTLLPPVGAQSAKAAAVIAWATGLRADLGVSGDMQGLIVAGLASDKAKLQRWRMERVVLPAELLLHPEAARILVVLLQEAEETHRQLRRIGAQAMAMMMADAANKETLADARARVDAGGFNGRFFARLEQALPLAMSQIAHGEAEEAYQQWRGVQAKAVVLYWDLLTTNLGATPAAWRAEAKCRFKLAILLSQLNGVGVKSESTQEVNA